MIDSTESAQNNPNVMAEDESTSDTEEQQETPTLPLSMWGGRPVKEGDVFQVRVVAVDENAGTASVTMAGYGGGMKRRMHGSDAMAEELNQPKQEGM